MTTLSFCQKPAGFSMKNKTDLPLYEAIPHCHTQINSQCTECNVGYFVTPNGSCDLSCPELPHCATCDTSGSSPKCETCMPTFYPLPFGAGCSPTPYCAVADCKSCSETSSGICEECNSGYNLDGHMFHRPPCCPPMTTSRKSIQTTVL